MHFLGYSTRTVHGSNPLLAQESALHPPRGTTSPFWSWCLAVLAETSVPLPGCCPAAPDTAGLGSAGPEVLPSLQGPALFCLCLGMKGVLVPFDSHTEGQEGARRVGSRDEEQLHHLPRPPSPPRRSSAARGGREQGEGEQVSSAAEYKHTQAHACTVSRRSRRPLARAEGTTSLE